MEFKMENNNQSDFEYFTESQEAPKTDAKIKSKQPKRLDVKTLVGVSMFAALAYIATFIFRINVMFLTFDVKDAVITISSFIYGPLAALVSSFLVAFLEFITISGTGVYGFIMNFASSAAFSVTASLIYKHKRDFLGAIISIYSASVVLVAVMMAMNVLVTPYYMTGGNVEAVVALIPKLLLPFNVAKALMNSAVVMLLYKPVSQALKRARLVKGSFNMRFNKQSVYLLIIAILTAAAAAALFIVTKSING
ncbi:MAG: ECF transporter S component [Clostridia bacterium]|nr:ECF transporter S component [Clostridia bacterium]